MQIRVVISNSLHSLQSCKAFVIQNFNDVLALGERQQDQNLKTEATEWIIPLKNELYWWCLTGEYENKSAL